MDEQAELSGSSPPTEQGNPTCTSLPEEKSPKTHSAQAEDADVPAAENTQSLDIADPDYLDSFNIDTEVELADSNLPHYIVNLNVYNTDNIETVTSLPVKVPNVLGSQQPTPSSQTPTSSPVGYVNTGRANYTSSKVSTQPHFMPMYRHRTRGRGRGAYVPLDDVMEKKIRTFEGRDCVQQLEQLHSQFPRFKRAYVNRIFTRNMLNYDITYRHLKEEHDREMEKCSKVRLIQTPKTEESKRQAVDVKTGRPDLSLQSHAFLYMGVPLGRCPPHVANSLYRRVIVTPEGNVEPADIHEQKFLDTSGLSTSILNTGGSSNDSKPRTSTTGLAPLTNAIPNIFDTLTATNSNHRKSDQASVSQVDARTYGSEDAVPQSGNRFFRTNRICETEMKKRGYLNRELRSATTGITANRSLVTKSDAESSEDGNRKSGDAVKYMAKVGVVSNSDRKRTEHRKKSLNKDANFSMVQNDDELNNAVNSKVVCLDDGLKLTNEERKQLIAFFNEGTMEELTLMPGCSRKTAQTLLTLRPFSDTNDLIKRTSALRQLSSNLADSCKDILQMRSSVVRLLQKCERLTQRVSEHSSRLLENPIRLADIPDGDPKSPELKGEACSVSDYDVRRNDNEPIQLLRQQPAILNPVRELKPYQLVGLNWLRLLHHEQVNGILADEMGLGKTVQAVAFLASLWEGGDRGPHLIICPSSTQDNWQRELALWCPHLKVLVYQGSTEQRKAIRLKVYGTEQIDFNVLLTSYAVGTSAIEDRALMKRLNFHYGIFDEAHMLKNMTSQRYRNLMNFQVQRRLLLTGTPLQNNLLELVSLLSFVMPEMFMKSTDLLKRIFQIYSKPMSSSESDSANAGGPVRSTFEEERLIHAKNLLQPFCLRRLKSQVLDQLPPKTFEVVHVPLTPSQATHYHDLVKSLRSIRESNEATKNTFDNKCQTNEKTVNNGEIEPPTLDDLDEPPLPKRLCPDDHSAVNGTKSCDVNKVRSNISHSPSNMVTSLRKAANHQALLSGIAYSDSTLRDIADSLHLDPSHVNADPQLIYEDLATMSDHQVHKVCLYYEALSSYALSPESIISGSGKIQWLNENLPKFISDGHRILIFSQFVIMLDILEEFLRITNRRYVRLDGSTPVAERQVLIDRFNSSSIEVFLLSTRAGGLGINLTGADMVIIHDIDFNPYNDRQAEDRCHRLGQRNPVHIIRLISENTVEEGIMRIANEKLRLEQNVTGGTTDESSFTVDLDECTTPEAVPPKKSNSPVKTGYPKSDINDESENVFKVLGSWNPTKADDNLNSNYDSTSNRVSEQDVRSLLSDALNL